LKKMYFSLKNCIELYYIEKDVRFVKAMNINKKEIDNTTEILGVLLTLCSFGEIIVYMENQIKHKNINHYISITNTESIFHATKIPALKKYINGADFSCCDGIGAVLEGKMRRVKIPRIHGPDLMLKCCGYGVNNGWRHFFYGGKKGVPEMISRKLSKQFPGLITAGTCSPPFRRLTPDEDDLIVNELKETQPDIVWVGLGLLKQEKWIADHIERIQAPWMIGVGAAFDFHAGTTRRAPSAFRKMGLEWLYRVCFEPRMIKRNLYSIPFLYMVIKAVLSNKPE